MLRHANIEPSLTGGLYNKLLFETMWEIPRFLQNVCTDITEHIVIQSVSYSVSGYTIVLFT